MRSRKSRKRVTTEEVRVVGTGKIVRKFLRYIDRLINSGNFVSYKVIMD
jgi:dihydrofolate reductase